MAELISSPTGGMLITSRTAVAVLLVPMGSVSELTLVATLPP